MKLAMPVFLSVFFLCACDRAQDSVTGKSSAIPEPNHATSEKQLAIVFEPKAIEPSPSGKGYVGFFIFENNTQHEIRLPGFEGAHAGSFTVMHVEFEVKENENWVKMNIGYDGIPPEFVVAPNSQSLLFIDLFAFEEAGVRTIARVRVGGYDSESFALEWQTDRTTGRFSRAQKVYLDKVREILRSAGFKSSELTGDDFCNRLIEFVINVPNAEKEGFAPLRGELEVVPIDGPGGNLRLDFHGSVKVGYEYQYSGMLVLNPESFDPTRFRTWAHNHVTIGMWGKARILKLDDGSGFYTEKNKLYFEIIYHAEPLQAIPNEDASTRVLLQMITNLGDCLELSDE